MICDLGDNRMGNEGFMNLLKSNWKILKKLWAGRLIIMKKGTILKRNKMLSRSTKKRSRCQK